MSDFLNKNCTDDFYYIVPYWSLWNFWKKLPRLFGRTVCLLRLLLNPRKVILFSSYAMGNPTEDSDLDVLVVLDSEERSKTFDEFIERGSPVSLALREVHKKIAMDIIVYTIAEFEYLREQKDFFVEEIVETGKVLYER